jgi:hypothetical protein
VEFGALRVEQRVEKELDEAARDFAEQSFDNPICAQQQ